MCERMTLNSWEVEEIKSPSQNVLFSIPESEPHGGQQVRLQKLPFRDPFYTTTQRF